MVADHKLTYQWESIRAVFAEPNWRDLIAEHWETLAVYKDAMPLDPDYQRCVALYDAGLLRCWTARHDGLLVGYIAAFIQPHLHYKTTLTAVEDLFLLSAPYRKGMAGVFMFKTFLSALKECGVKRIILHSKVHFEQERGGQKKLFERMGFVNTDLIWSKFL